MVCITLLCVQPIPILSAFFLCHPYIPLSNLKNFSFTCLALPLHEHVCGPPSTIGASVIGDYVTLCKLSAGHFLLGIPLLQYMIKNMGLAIKKGTEFNRFSKGCCMYMLGIDKPLYSLFLSPSTSHY